MGLLVNMLILCWALVLESSSTTKAAHHYYGSPPPRGNTFNVMSFGAVGNREVDDSQAFKSAWQAACRRAANSSVQVTVPGGKTYLLSQIGFQGPCKSPSITVKILGTIVAQPRSAWKNKSADEWLKFHGVEGLTVVGNEQGLVDGQGSTWWGNGVGDTDRPTAMRFSECPKLQVSGLSFKNSQRNHVSITRCNYAKISSLQMVAPPTSPNTDGIDISASTNLFINNCTMATGDDCIAINGGSSNITISNILCGPGHGISIGSLGKDGRRDEVEGIHVSNCTFHGTQNGVRIKTWQGGSGFARNISFSNINFIASGNPVIIDQFYCPHKQCNNQTSAVKISDVRYTELRGTSMYKNTTLIFRCSQAVPCTNIVLDNVDIISIHPHETTSSQCINAYVRAFGPVDPVVKCLGKASTDRIVY